MQVAPRLKRRGLLTLLVLSTAGSVHGQHEWQEVPARDQPTFVTLQKRIIDLILHR